MNTLHLTMITVIIHYNQLQCYSCTCLENVLSQGKVHSNLHASFYNIFIFIFLLMFVYLENFDTLFSCLSYCASYDFVPKRNLICQHVVISHNLQFNIYQHHLNMMCLPYSQRTCFGFNLVYLALSIYITLLNHMMELEFYI